MKRLRSQEESNLKPSVRIVPPRVQIHVLVTLFTYDLDCGHGDVRLLGMEVSENKNLEPFDEQKSRVYYLLRQCCD